ncbi:flagellar motor switch protein FliG [Aquipuribacter sp. SD81]|uniref:flagellar motor switch protein FliG n=1 Tax=Aquipuribacter sp. SD81 TaxID=3127703 RepID=UPI003019A816
MSTAVMDATGVEQAVAAVEAAAGSVAVPPGPDLTGLQKAAVLLVMLGKDRAATVLKHLKGTDLDELVAQLVRLRDVPPSVAGQVLSQFHSLAVRQGVVGAGGEGFARDVLERSLGKDDAGDVMRRIASVVAERPLKFLQDIDPQQLMSILRGEHPQTLAAVLVHLRPDQASVVMAGLSPTEQSAVARRIATTGRFHPQALSSLQDVLKARTSSVLPQSQTETATGGVQSLVEVINRADAATEKSILEGLEATDAALAEEVKARLFVFADIVGLEDRAVQMVLRQVDSVVLATALKSVAQNVRDKVLQNVSERARADLVEEIEVMGAVRVSAVEEAQATIVQVIRSLEESGQLVVRRGGDDEYVS